MASVNGPLIREPVFRKPPVVEFDPNEKISLGPEFQKSLLRLLTEDNRLAGAVIKHLKPEHFGSEILAWVYAVMHRHAEKYGVFPSLRVVHHEAEKLAPGTKETYRYVLADIEQAPLRDAAWLRDNLILFVRDRTLKLGFLEAARLYEQGCGQKAIDVMKRYVDTIQKVTLEKEEKSYFFEELDKRQMERLAADREQEAVPTGFGWLDTIFVGGAHKGELYIWLGDAKAGKTTMLINLALAAVRGLRKVYHLIYEADLRQVGNRYDSAFMEVAYNDVKSGNISDDALAKAKWEYAQYQRALILRAYTQKWDYSVVTIEDALEEEYRLSGWSPDLLVVDYIDLLQGRNAPYKNSMMRETDVVRDLKTMAKRGHTVWTATQAQRPDKDAEPDSVLKARQIANCYEKVRVADFIGSINSTKEERDAGVVRLYAELYRDNAANQELTVRANFAQMRIFEEPGVISPVVQAPKSPALGYVTHQTKIPL